MKYADYQDRSVVVMPAAKRPEFAALALEQLGQSWYCPEILLCVDTCGDRKEFQHVYDWYAPQGTSLIFRGDHPPVSSGCWNISTSIKDGYETGSDYVFLVEEDVLIYRDFFTYHWGEMEAGAKVSCGRACPLFNKRYPTMYTNPGSCFSRDFLDLLVPHINDEFFTDVAKYFERRLPFPATPGLHGLDDGLIRRVLLREYWQPVIPPMDNPRCAHIGCAAIENKYDFVGWRDGEIEAKIEALRNFLKTVDREGPKEMYLRDLDRFPADLL
jgi:hypothetical protein